MPDFVDHVVLHAAAGRGGDGCASTRREKFVPLGGPDGGNGGDGGDVVVQADASVKTLLDYHRRPHRRAPKGLPGRGGNRHGAAGDDLVLPVPVGTVVKAALDDMESMEDGAERQARDQTYRFLADLSRDGDRYVLAHGGKGGLGNAALASPRRKVPGFALKGEPGEQRRVFLELKVVADVGLVGLPNAGKSSLIAALSAARPKIAPYPFTTLVPNLGVVEAGDEHFIVADVPGLIPGASEGKGLGFAFLRHIERCSTLVHVVDCATDEPGRDPLSDYDTIEAELEAYGGLADRPRIVVLNKVDVPDARDLAAMVRPEFERRGVEVYETSAATREGLRAMAFAMAGLVRAARAAQAAAPTAEPARPVLRPRQLAGRDFQVVRTGANTFLVRGEKPARWVRQTDFGNDEAVGYLADRLARLGVEEALREAGAEAGAEVLIGEPDDAVVFDWDPSTPAGVGRRHGRRGSDPRLEGR